MPDRQKMNPVLFYIERVNDSIVADASSETIRPFDSVAARSFTATSRLPVYVATPCRSIQLMMLERAELRTNLINFCFDSRAESGWKLEKCSVKTRVINLSRRAHEPSGSLTRAAFPAATSRSDC